MEILCEAIKMLEPYARLGAYSFNLTGDRMHKSMATVEIYTTPLCGFCSRAKRLLDTKGVTYTEVDPYQQPERRDEMLSRSHGRRTVPQIFIDNRHIGGCDDLYALDDAGRLDALLKRAI